MMRCKIHFMPYFLKRHIPKFPHEEGSSRECLEIIQNEFKRTTFG